MVIRRTLTVAKTRAFFEGPTQMAIPKATMAQLANEGISQVDDLTKFDKETIEKITHNL